MSKASDLIAKINEASSDLDEVRIEGCFRGAALMKLDEGKLVSGRFEKNIRIDQPTHLLGGDPHAHVLGRKGNQVVVVNLDGTGSHGTKGRLHHKDAETLRQNGFTIRDDRIVEWWVCDVQDRILLNG